MLANEGLAELAKVHVQKQTMLGGLCHEGREVTTTLSPDGVQLCHLSAGHDAQKTSTRRLAVGAREDTRGVEPHRGRP